MTPAEAIQIHRLDQSRAEFDACRAAVFDDDTGAVDLVRIVTDGEYAAGIIRQRPHDVQRLLALMCRGFVAGCAVEDCREKLSEHR